MPFPANHIVTADELAAMNNVAGITVAATGADSTTSATYVDMAAPSSFSFAKRITSTGFKIDLDITTVATVVATTAQFGVSINGVDYDVSRLYTNEASSRKQASGSAIVAVGLAAGTYVIQLRWKRTLGTGTCQRFVTDDWLSLMATEVNP